MPVVGPAYHQSSLQAHGNPMSGFPGGYPGQPGGLVPVVSVGNGQFVPAIPGGQGPGMMPPGGAIMAPPRQMMPPLHMMTMHDQAEAARMAQDYEALVNIIKQLRFMMRF